MTEAKQTYLTHYVQCDERGTPSPMTDCSEPDYIQWNERFNDCWMMCRMRRDSISKTWCAYVDIPPDHPWRSIPDGLSEFRVLAPGAGDANEAAHVGVTFFRRGIVGFDCDHYGDAKPGEWDETGRYRDAEYVMRCTLRLAAVVYATRNAGGAQ